MAGNPARYGTPKSLEPVIHELPAVQVGTVEVSVRLAAWRADDGTWRGRLMFGPPGAEATATADIFCAANESDLWESVRDLREHHLRDLYRSLAQ
jgi:hypothetical protein